MVSPEHKRQMAAFVVEGHLCSGRTACRCLRLARSSFQYRMRPATSERTRLVTRLHELSRKYPRYGFRRIVVKLRVEGYKVGRKQGCRSCGGPKACGYRRPGGTSPRRGESTGLPTQADHSWPCV